MILLLFDFGWKNLSIHRQWMPPPSRACFYLFSISGTFFRSRFNVKFESFWSWCLLVSGSNRNKYKFSFMKCPHVVSPFVGNNRRYAHIERELERRQQRYEEQRKYLLMNSIRYAILKTHYVASKPLPLAFSEEQRRRTRCRTSEWETEKEREKDVERERWDKKVLLNKYCAFKIE